MGKYLNSKSSYDAYEEIYHSPYYVDKTLMLEDIIPRIRTSCKYICITRPRRFGKSVMANMIAAYFSKGCPTAALFDTTKIAGRMGYKEQMNQHNVIHIAFNKIPSNCNSYEDYITRIEDGIKRDLVQAFPNAENYEDDALWDILSNIYEENDGIKFIFILDEWDYIFHREFVTRTDQTRYIEFLSCLLKDQPYVSLAYMTGILPIAKYSSGSELNMFAEYTMASEGMYSDCFGFTESDTDDLYARFLQNQPNPKVTREGLKIWYNGYHTKSGERVYNPRSVVLALMNNNLGNYWTSAGPYDEIFYYIEHNVAAVRDDLAQMIAGIPVPAKIREYAAVSQNLGTKDEIFSAMVVYGFLSYENGYVSIPNKELMDKFNDMLVKEKTLGYVNRLACESGKMLQATLSGDIDTMVQILEYAHDTESPLLSYNSEAELVTLINLIYLQARDNYRIECEDKAGIGYADFIFYPETDRNQDAIILEIKVNDTAEKALQQIKNRKYALKVDGHIGEIPRYTGRILGVGISYNKKTKVHSCKVEVLRESNKGGF